MKEGYYQNRRDAHVLPNKKMADWYMVNYPVVFGDITGRALSHRKSPEVLAALRAFLSDAEAPSGARMRIQAAQAPLQLEEADHNRRAAAHSLRRLLLWYEPDEDAHGQGHANVLRSWAAFMKNSAGSTPKPPKAELNFPAPLRRKPAPKPAAAPPPPVTVAGVTTATAAQNSTAAALARSDAVGGATAAAKPGAPSPAVPAAGAQTPPPKPSGKTAAPPRKKRRGPRDRSY